jgi:dipeptidyl aminopeptidase/acylaminoacyl peptidase
VIWSPNGEYILLAVKADSVYNLLYLYDLKNDKIKVVTETLNTTSTIKWSDDSTFFIYEDFFTTSMLAHYIKDGSETVIQIPHQSNNFMYYAPQISPDNKTLLLNCQRPPKNSKTGVLSEHFFIIYDIASKKLIESNTYTDFISPCWYPDGKNLLIDKRDKNGNYYAVNISISSPKTEKTICKITSGFSWKTYWLVPNEKLMVLQDTLDNSKLQYGLIDVKKKTYEKIEDEIKPNSTKLFNIDTNKYFIMKDGYINILDYSGKLLAKHTNPLKTIKRPLYYIMDNNTVLLSDWNAEEADIYGNFGADLYVFDVNSGKQVLISSKTPISYPAVNRKMNKLAYMEKSEIVYLYDFNKVHDSH